jgi:hypothetical protein
MHIPPENLPDPWLFDSEKLLRELDRCRELVLKIPAPTHEAHFAASSAINAIWNLSEHLRFLLHLHRTGQRAFADRHQEKNSETAAKPQLLPRSAQQ